MCVDITTYRVRIGLFSPSRGKNKQHGKESYVPTTLGSDIHYRVLICCALYLGVFTATHLALTVHTNFREYVCLSADIVWYNMKPDTLFRSSCSTSYDFFAQMKLILSADVESNPGPNMKDSTSANPRNDTDKILAAIQETRDSLTHEIQTVKIDVLTIKVDLDNINTICHDVQKQMTSIKSKQAELEEHQREHDAELETWKQEKEMLQLDVDTMHNLLEQNADKINKLEDEFENLDKLSRSKNIRIFGLEIDNLSQKAVKSAIVENVLKVAYPDGIWGDNDIEEAYCVGGSSGASSRITIVKFWSSDTKHTLFSNRDKLRLRGLRISNDLTVNQRSKLAAVKEKGHTGYYYKGELKVRETKQPNNNANGRLFMNATRRLPGTSENMEVLEHDSVDEAAVQNASSKT